MPLNRDTEYLFYNKRLIVDGFVLTEPRAWHITKVNRFSPNGIAMVTMAQDTFDQLHDVIEYDENNNVIGMWADLIQPDNIQQDPPDDVRSVYSQIFYAGTNPNIKIGGSYKKFTVKFYDEDGEIDYMPGNWSYTINGIDASDLLEISTTSLDENQIKIKFIGGDDYIGETLVVEFTAGDIKSNIQSMLLAL